MLALVCVSTASLALPSYGLPTLFAFLQEEFRLSRGELGLFLSALEAGTVLSFIVGGWAADAFGVRRILPLAQVLMGLGGLALAHAAGYTQSLAILVFTGLTFGLGSPAVSITILLWFPVRQRATAMGIKQAGAPLAGILAAAFLPSPAFAAGWRGGIQLLGLSNIAVALLVFLFYRDPPAIHRVGVGARPGRRQIWALVWQRDLLIVNVYSSVLFAYQFIVVGYLMLYLRDQLDMPLVAGGLVLAATQAGALVGRIGWGVFSDLALQGQRVPALGLAGGIATALMVVVALLPPGVPLWLLALVAFAVGFSAMGWQALRYALVADLSPPGAAGTVFGVSQTIAETGLIVGPPLFGMSADLLGYRPAWLGVGVLTALTTLAVMRWIDERAAAAAQATIPRPSAASVVPLSSERHEL